MKRLTVLALLAPALALAAPQANPPAKDGDRAVRQQHMQKRMRLARTIGLAEALDLDDAGALRARDVLAKYDERRAPLREQVQSAVKILRDAAHGDQAAAGQVDASLARARDARAKLQQLDAQMLDELSKGFTPERKARAALFLATFHARARHFAGPGGPGMGGPGMHGPGMGPGMRGGPGMMGPGGPGGRRSMEEGGPGGPPERMTMSEMDEGGPDLEDEFGAE